MTDGNMREEKLLRGYRFADLVIDLDCFCVIRNGQTQKITPRAFEVLCYLIEHRARVVEKAELFSAVWGGTFVTDNALTRMIKEIRRVLDDDADAPRYIATLPKRGYRFIAEPDAAAAGKVAVTPNPAARPPALEPSAAIDTIAVLPFLNVGGDSETEYLSDGIAEGVLNRLALLPDLRILPRSTVERFRGRDAVAVETGRALGVQAVVLGRIEVRQQKLVARIELVDVVREAQLWGERFERPATDLFLLPEEIAREIAERLRLRLSDTQKQRLGHRQTRNLAAYQCYLKGRYFWNRRPAGLDKAIEYFSQAIDADPRFALAYSGLADCYSTLGSWENGAQPPREVMPKAKAAATRALELDPILAEAHASLAYVHLHYDWDWAGAEEKCLRAIELNPNYATAHHWYSHVLMYQQRVEESLAVSERCLALEPLDLILNVHLGWHYYHARAYQQALDCHQRTAEFDPHSIWPHFEIGRCLTALRRYPEAIAAFERAGGGSAPATFAIAALGHAAALAGRRDEARQCIIRLEALASHRYVSPYDFAIIRLGLGQMESALDWLERASEERAGWIIYLDIDPRLDPLRAEPRFAALRQSIGLSGANMRSNRSGDQG